jgi:hypothetical protein
MLRMFAETSPASRPSPLLSHVTFMSYNYTHTGSFSEHLVDIRIAMGSKAMELHTAVLGMLFITQSVYIDAATSALNFPWTMYWPPGEGALCTVSRTWLLRPCQ